MKNEKQTIRDLKGEPSATAVSDEAMGKTPQTAEEVNRAYQMMRGNIMVGEADDSKPTEYDACDIEEAYANIFKGLHMLAKSHSSEEDSEELPEPPENEDE